MQKKQVVGTQRLQKHNLQHLYAPKFAIFHGKTAKNAHLLVKNGVFWPQTGSCRAPPPNFEGAGCKEKYCVDTQIAQTQFTAFLCQKKMCHFSTTSAKNSHFFNQKLYVFLSLKQAAEPPPLPIGECSLQRSGIRQRTRQNTIVCA